MKFVATYTTCAQVGENSWQEFKTSAEWQTIHNKVIVLDPDGWNRKDYEYSWYEELISEQEYLKRVSFSTVMSL